MLKPQNDSDQTAWKFYKSFYGNKLTTNDKNRHLTYKDISIDVNGDVCFNVKLQPQKRYTLLGSIVKKEDCFSRLKELLDSLLYSPINISILPKTGGLNTVKGQFTCDRFDSFIWLINAYYHGLRAPIVNRGTKNSYISNQSKLADFLDKIGSTEKFCHLFYGVNDDELIEELIASGVNDISTPNEFYNYLQLAIKFWNARINVLKQKKESLNNDISFNDIFFYEGQLSSLSKLLEAAITESEK